MGLLTRTQGMGAAALALGLGVFLSRILGLVRDKIISYYFGTGMEADVYFNAFVLPDFLNYLLAGGYFSISLVPLLASYFARDEEGGWRFFSAAVLWAFLAIAALTALAWAFVPALAPLIAPGFSPEALERLKVFLRIILPAQVCFLPGACFTAMLYFRRQFTVPALTPLVYNGCIIICGVALYELFPDRGMEGYCWGVLLGAALGSLCMPLLAVRAGGMRLLPPGFTLFNPGMKTLLFLALPLMLGQSIVVLDEQFVRIFGSLTGEGGVSLLNYARRIMLVPVGVVAQAAGVASYPFLASLAASGDKEGFDQSLNRAAASTLLVALPLSLCMAAIAEPTMRLIFQQGSFSAQAATQSGLLLAVMLLGVAFWAVQQVVGRAFYANRDTLTPALAGSATTALALPAYWFGARSLGTTGVALAGTLGIVLYTLLLTHIWRRRYGPGGLSGLLGKAVKAFAVCLPAAGAGFGAARFAGSFFAEASLAGAAVEILAGGTVFAGIYFGLALLVARPLAAPFLDFAGRVLARARGKRA